MDYRKTFLESILIVDTETTSLDKEECEIIELGVAQHLDDDWVGQSMLFKPSQPIPPECSVITGISNNMVKDKPHFMEVGVSDMPLISNVYEVYVAHNAGYDGVVLQNHGIRLSPYLCTYQLAKKVFSFIDGGTQGRLDLGYLRYSLDLDPTDTLVQHRADSDCILTGRLLVTLIDILEEIGKIDTNEPYYEQIIDFMQTPVILQAVPFGKHRGKKFSEVPKDYWMWAINNMDMLDENDSNYDADLAESILRSLEE